MGVPPWSRTLNVLQRPGEGYRSCDDDGLQLKDYSADAARYPASMQGTRSQIAQLQRPDPFVTLQLRFLHLLARL
jgi:hypothetical protein